MMLNNAAVFTDLYELTMMQGYWSSGKAGQSACFEHFFRRVPEDGGYCIAAGIEDALELVTRMRFRAEHIEYLASLNLFESAFLEQLRTLRFTGEIRAVADGTVIFPNEPILEVRGPLIEAQWIETLLLNIVNFQTLIATKASRMVHVARPASVVEFGLRRAQGPNGGLWATRAAYLAGFLGTSNVEAGFRYGIPLFGTHAHSWVMSFPDELAAFQAYGETFPDDSVLLIDTYDTLEQGLRHAIEEGKRLEAAGHRLKGIRLDSGDLAYLSKACRAALDAADLNYVKILASSDLDEYVIQELKLQGATIDVFGVGTRAATAFPEPALGGVYKLTAVEENGKWVPKMKISSNPAKSTIPGRKQIWRCEQSGQYVGDALAFDDEPAPNSMVHPMLDYKRTSFDPAQLRPLLQSRIEHGELIGNSATLAETRALVASELEKLPAEHKRLTNPHLYRVGLSPSLWQFRRDMMTKLTNR